MSPVVAIHQDQREGIPDGSSVTSPDCSVTSPVSESGHTFFGSGLDDGAIPHGPAPAGL